MFINITNNGDSRVLRDTVRKLQSAYEHERNNADILKSQRDSQILEATVYANLARSLAEELNLPREKMLRLRDKCKVACKADLNRRGLKDFAEKPPKFTVKL